MILLPTLLALAAAPADAGPSAVANQIEADAPTGIEKGQRLTLVSHVGAIRIERPVTALQAPRPHDRRIFVRTDDGEVFAASVGPKDGGRHD